MATNLLHPLECDPELLVNLVELCLADVEQLFAALFFPDVSCIGCEGQGYHT